MDPYKFDSGAVFEIPLMKGYGYSYVKIINVPGEYPDTIIKPFNYFSKDPFLGDVVKFNDISYTFAPYLLLGGIPVRGVDKWKHLGDVSITREDESIPDFKATVQIFHFINEEIPLDALIWDVVKGLEPVPRYPADLENIKHLGLYMHTDSKYIQIALTVAWLYRKGEEVANFFTDQEFNRIHALKEIPRLTKLVV